jgi:hypothetical protein
MERKMIAYLDNFTDITPSILQDILQPLTRSTSLVGDAALDQLAGGIRWDLAGDEDVWAGDDGLGVGAHGFESETMVSIWHWLV